MQDIDGETHPFPVDSQSDSFLWFKGVLRFHSHRTVACRAERLFSLPHSLAPPSMAEQGGLLPRPGAVAMDGHSPRAVRRSVLAGEKKRQKCEKSYSDKARTSRIAASL